MNPLRAHASAAVLILAVLQAADVLTTRLVLARGGVEGNPLMAGLVSRPLLALAAKMVCVAAAWCASRRAPSWRALCGLWMVCGFYLSVVMANVFTMGAA